jgi:hypothetical protein
MDIQGVAVWVRGANVKKKGGLGLDMNMYGPAAAAAALIDFKGWGAIKLRRRKFFTDEMEQCCHSLITNLLLTKISSIS